MLGHCVVVHGCTVRRGSLIGIGAIVLNGAEIGEESIVAAGSVVAPKTVIPPRSLAIGTPAKVVRTLNDDDIRMIQGTGEEYLELMEIYKKISGPLKKTTDTSPLLYERNLYIFQKKE